MGETIILKTERSNQENCEIINGFTVTQSEVNGFVKLLHWLEGFQAAKSGQIPGNHEVLMFYRSLCHHIYEQQKKAEKPESIQVPQSGTEIVLKSNEFIICLNKTVSEMVLNDEGASIQIVNPHKGIYDAGALMLIRDILKIWVV